MAEPGARPRVPPGALGVGLGTQKAEANPMVRDTESYCERKVYMRG